MPLNLPSGITPTPILFQPNEVLAGGVITGFRFEMLDLDDQLIGELDGVEGGGVEWTAYTGIKGSGNMTVKDVGQDVDWLNVRIRPVALSRGFGVELDEEHPLGIYVCAAPKEQWTSLGMTRNVEMLDKCSVLDQDVVTDENGDPVTYVAPIGANIVELVVDLIQGVGEATPAIEPDTVTLAASMTWDVLTPVLQIVNELLEVGGYSSLYLDDAGQFRISKYESPAQRQPVYSALAPFTVGNRSVLSPEWERDRDIYNIPNRYVAIGIGDGTTEAARAVATNTDINSPFSFQARGRWITRGVAGVEAASEAELETRALMGLAQASSVTSGLSISHRFLPELHVNSTIRFQHPDAELDLLTYVTKTSVPFSPTELCKSEIREAVV